MAEDRILKCRDCGQDFTFSAGEQEFYAQKGFTNEPARCAQCRQTRKRERASSGNVRFRDRESFSGSYYGSGSQSSGSSFDRDRF